MKPVSEKEDLIINIRLDADIVDWFICRARDEACSPERKMVSVLRDYVVEHRSQRESLDELTALGQELGLYDKP